MSLLLNAFVHSLVKLIALKSQQLMNRWNVHNKKTDNKRSKCKEQKEWERDGERERDSKTFRTPSERFFSHDFNI